VVEAGRMAMPSLVELELVMSPAVSSVPKSKTNVAASNGKVMREDRYEPSYYRHVIRSLSA
jgi:hypothetical protein